MVALYFILLIILYLTYQGFLGVVDLIIESNTSFYDLANQNVLAAYRSTLIICISLLAIIGLTFKIRKLGWILAISSLVFFILAILRFLITEFLSINGWKLFVLSFDKGNWFPVLLMVLSLGLLSFLIYSKEKFQINSKLKNNLLITLALLSATDLIIFFSMN